MQGWGEATEEAGWPPQSPGKNQTLVRRINTSVLQNLLETVFLKGNVKTSEDKEPPNVVEVGPWHFPKTGALRMHQ